MIIVGLILVVVAVASAAVVIVQNRDAVVDVHALGHTWSGYVYSLLVAGLVMAVVAFLGLALLRAGVVRARRHRRERALLLAENQRLIERVRTNPQSSGFFAGGPEPAPDVVVPAPDFDGDARLVPRSHRSW